MQLIFLKECSLDESNVAACVAAAVSREGQLHNAGAVAWARAAHSVTSDNDNNGPLCMATL